ncbi:His Kinase A (phospho-acceptor) domain-containing protein [Alteribacillus persepolensis]|uniref:histidine kinase n=1 Tax=Alteribacillus persepolensis TaxID=568899 RepID=A0A1G8IP79_9BACI|nr:His Kinase A (phospho-acceptor) domain-containing protein [Alteribacillus persepolensis]
MVIVLRVWFFGVMLILLASCSTGTAIDYKAEGGVLDLRGWNQSEEKIVSLDGEWEFYWKSLDGPGQDKDASSYLHTPGSWQLENEELPHHGYATYRLKVLLPDNQGVYGLYVPSMYSAYQMWVDNEMLASSGQVGTSRADMAPRHLPKTVYFESGDTEVDIWIHVSDFYQRKTGWTEPIQLGSSAVIQAKRDQNVTTEMIFIVSLGAMALYHFGLFAMRPQHRTALYFGGTCAAIMVRTLLLGEVLLMHFLPWLNWEFSLKLEYWSPSVAVLCFILYIDSQFKGEMRNRSKRLLIGALMAFNVFVLLTPARIFTEMMIVLQALCTFGLFYLIIILWKAFYHKKCGAGLHVAAMSFLFVFVIMDILYYNEIIATGETVSIGLFAYLIAQSFYLSREYTNALRQSEALSAHLQKVNQTLEEQVEVRTGKLVKANESLRKANDQLFNMHKARRELMTNISHELNTPLTSIQGYIKAMIDRVVEPGNPKYLELVYNKTVFLDKLIEDLRELSKLDAKTITYQLERTDIAEFMSRLSASYYPEMEKAGIAMRFVNSLSNDADKTYMVELDHIRMEQVISNLLYNAEKFTLPGGRVELELTFDRENHNVCIFVHDTGAGIKKQDLPYVFHRFYKGTVNTHPEEGGGLGLAICKEIVAGHGGHMGVESIEGEGSSFCFTLPVQEIVPSSDSKAQMMEK